jgi:hypothetical protein
MQSMSITTELCVRIPLRRGVLDTTFCDKRCQSFATDRWFSLDTPVSSNNKTDDHDITEMLLKVSLKTITLIILYQLFTSRLSLDNISMFHCV